MNTHSTYVYQFYFVSVVADIASNNAATYISGALTVNTWFRRLPRVSCSSNWSGAVESNVIMVTVKADFGLGNFTTINKQYFTGTYTIVSPTTNNTNPIVYSSDNSAVATISGTAVTIIGADEATITASKAADAAYT